MESVVLQLNQSVPWVWYLSRATGILAFIFLWFSVFLGLAIRNPMLKKLVKPIYSFDFHCFLAATATFWAFVHATSLIFHKEFPLGMKDVFVPFYSHTTLVSPFFMSLGIMAFYGMVILVVTSYIRKHLGHRLWRVMHFLSPVAFLFVVFHGFYNGTDMKNPIISIIYITSALVLVVLYISNLVFKRIGKQHLRG